MHEARAGVHAGEHACMCLVLGCMSKNMRTRGSCWRAHRRTCVHEARAGVHAGKHACTSPVLAYTLENMRTRALCWRARRRPCVREFLLECMLENMPC